MDTLSDNVSGRLRAGFRRTALATQSDYNDRLLDYLREQMLHNLSEAHAPDVKTLVSIAPFDVLSRNGGAARVLGLASAPAKHLRVNILSVAGPRRAPEIIPDAPRVRLYAVPASDVFCAAIEKDRAALGDAAFSLGLARHLEQLPLLTYWYRQLTARATCCVLNQPYLIRLWENHSPSLPLLYDVPEVNSLFTLRMAEKAGDMDRKTPDARAPSRRLRWGRNCRTVHRMDRICVMGSIPEERSS